MYIYRASCIIATVILYLFITVWMIISAINVSEKMCIEKQCEYHNYTYANGRKDCVVLNIIDNYNHHQCIKHRACPPIDTPCYLNPKYPRNSCSSIQLQCEHTGYILHLVLSIIFFVSATIAIIITYLCMFPKSTAIEELKINEDEIFNLNEKLTINSASEISQSFESSSTSLSSISSTTSTTSSSDSST